MIRRAVWEDFGVTAYFENYNILTKISNNQFNISVSKLLAQSIRINRVASIMPCHEIATPHTREVRRPRLTVILMGTAARLISRRTVCVIATAACLLAGYRFQPLAPGCSVIEPSGISWPRTLWWRTEDGIRCNYHERGNDVRCYFYKAQIVLWLLSGCFSKRAVRVYDDLSIWWILYFIIFWDIWYYGDRFISITSCRSFVFSINSSSFIRFALSSIYCEYILKFDCSYSEHTYMRSTRYYLSAQNTYRSA